MAKMELMSSSARRILAERQLELAVKGKAGISWPFDYEALSLDDDEL